MKNAQKTGLLQQAKNWAVKLQRDVFALYLAAKRPETPWYAKWLAGAVVAYALSPIDLVPDFIPLLGYLDDLIIVPIGIAASIMLIPPATMEECRKQAEGMALPKSMIGASIIITIWLAIAIWIAMGL